MRPVPSAVAWLAGALAACAPAPPVAGGFVPADVADVVLTFPGPAPATPHPEVPRGGDPVCLGCHPDVRAPTTRPAAEKHVHEVHYAVVGVAPGCATCHPAPGATRPGEGCRLCHTRDGAPHWGREVR